MKLEFDWNKSLKQLQWDKTGGEDGRKFLANQAKAFMNPYVPADELILSQNVRTYVEGEHGVVQYNSPYAHYQYMGELYVSSRTGSAWASEGEYKVPAGTKLKYDTFRHSLATDHWDKAMMVARKGDLARAMQNHLKKR